MPIIGYDASLLPSFLPFPSFLYLISIAQILPGDRLSFLFSLLHRIASFVPVYIHDPVALLRLLKISISVSTLFWFSLRTVGIHACVFLSVFLEINMLLLHNRSCNYPKPKKIQEIMPFKRPQYFKVLIPKQPLYYYVIL